MIIHAAESKGVAETIELGSSDIEDVYFSTVRGRETQGLAGIVVEMRR